ncbi:MAG: hypothetical protein A2087_02935 [Spirochaetes bacterium GWD1_61_31]|nr:MAG: hypothetical protein A2Y37_14030 [Spirochaetes bacterium GWB1_60_80]OHD34740.1 MAG: hypothetical protein A2004_00225 [Spirochaetes bacterium GWC1_61_12]OHD38724.1 MAG: hypothetical protein A2087_02935 [Spirochaetes bacterium GWD1_61_31]OHD44469.1 MAG: hypothetical protein A2Y35_04870 [Spirochaetes bacterium GWE1_60_18]OHD59381.1 MAG: hypothetical protein A2Y32_08625 [Spirochaetes bacterium GWF1_60_12]
MPNKKKILDLIFDDWIAKVLCLVVALVLYAFFHFNSLDEVPLSVPLTIITNDAFVPASQYPRIANLVLRGESVAIKAIQESDLEAIADFGAYGAPGTWRVPVRIVKRGQAVLVDPLSISVEPSEVSLTIEARLAKPLTVRPDLHGEVAAGFELTGFTVLPESVEAYGPVSLLAGIDEVLTEPISLNGRDKDFEIMVRVVRSNVLINHGSSEFITVRVRISQELVFRTFNDVPVQFVGLPDRFGLSAEIPPVAAVSVVLGGPRRQIEAFRIGADDFSVDLSLIDAVGEHELSVLAVLPEGLTLQSIQPATVLVTVEPRDIGGAQ